MTHDDQPTSVPTRSAASTLGVALIVLGAALALNSLLGPLLADRFEYPFSESMRNQTIGLEAFTLVVLVPVCLVLGVLALRGSSFAAPMAMGPAAFTVYMFAQYVVGPQYENYATKLVLHLGTFVLGGYVLLRAWAVARSTPRTLPYGRTPWVVVLVVFAVFVCLRYLDAITAIVGGGGELADEFALDPTMFWMIFWLDLGVVVPLTLATAIAVARGSAWAATAVHAIIGWYALVPASVAAMAITMVINDDPHESTGAAVAFVVAAVVFVVVAVGLYRAPREARDE